MKKLFIGLPQTSRESNVVKGFGLPDNEITDFVSTNQVVGGGDMGHQIFTSGFFKNICK